MMPPTISPVISAASWISSAVACPREILLTVRFALSSPPLPSSKPMSPPATIASPRPTAAAAAAGRAATAAPTINAVPAPTIRPFVKPLAAASAPSPRVAGRPDPAAPTEPTVASTSASTGSPSSVGTGSSSHCNSSSGARSGLSTFPLEISMFGSGRPTWIRGSRVAREPRGSERVIGLPCEYAYRLTPSPSPIGSAAVHRPNQLA